MSDIKPTGNSSTRLVLEDLSEITITTEVTDHDPVEIFDVVMEVRILRAGDDFFTDEKFITHRLAWRWVDDELEMLP